MKYGESLIEILQGDARLHIAVEHDKNGYFASCPNLPGCHAQGDSYAEVVANIHEAAALYLASLND